MTSADSPVVLIIDDDPRMRAATERLLRTVGLHFESFATPQDFSKENSPMARVALCWMCDFLE